MDRRKFLQYGSVVSASALMNGQLRAAENWGGGDISHLIPLASHDKILLKVSFANARRNPVLRIGSREIPGRPGGTLGRFWSFAAAGLESAQEYELQLREGDTALAESWPLRTTPAPDAPAESFRMLIYSCAGGPDNAVGENGVLRYLPVSTRRRMFQRALSFNPDLAVGIGDQVYWDQTVARRWNSEAARRSREFIWGKYGSFDEDLPVFGSPNETTLTGCLDEQLGGLYATNFRSVPLILTQDDHDYFENDEGTEEVFTFPPRNFTARLGRAQQSLYFPEYLPEANRPAHLAGSGSDGVSESYGSYRWGNLLELLLYDCRRFISVAGPTSVFVEPQAERWMTRRTADETAARHLIHIPSTPMGWTAGKWGEWYPDYLQPDGTLGLENPKPYWQSGWFSQHQRILSSLSAQDERVALMISGDLHAIGSGLIHRSGGAEFENPIQTVLAGPISTGTGWPSASRGIEPKVPVDLEVEERVKPLEQNGFTIVDVDPDSIEVRQFAWQPEMGLDVIDDLQPFSSFSLSRRG